MAQKGLYILISAENKQTSLPQKKVIMNLRNSPLGNPAVILLIALFFGCTKDCDRDNPKEGNTYFVTSIISDVLPYNHYETIKFKRNNTDTVSFTGGRVETGFDEALTSDSCPSISKLQWMTQT